MAIAVIGGKGVRAGDVRAGASSRRWRTLSVAAVFGSSWLRCAPALAHDAPLVPVRIQAAEGERIELLRREDRVPVATCISSCVAPLPAGQYQVQLWSPDEKLIGERRMKLTAPATWKITPHDSKARDAGLAMGIAGSALFIGGAVLVMPVLMDSMCHDSEGCTTDAERSRAKVGLPLMLGGAILAPLGWVLFGRNIRPRVQVSSSYAPQRDVAGSRFRFGFELSL